MHDFKLAGNEVSFWLRVKPRATHERLTRGSEGELRLELHAPATDGQANDACIRFFAGALDLPKSNIAIISGQRARRKLIRLVVKSPDEIVTRIGNLVTAGKS